MGRAKVMFWTLLVGLIGVLWLVGCGGGGGALAPGGLGGGGAAAGMGSGSMVMTIHWPTAGAGGSSGSLLADIPDSTVSIRVKLLDAANNMVAQQQVDRAAGQSTATLTMNNVPSGSFTCRADALDSGGNVVASGSAQVTIAPNEVAAASITMSTPSPTETSTSPSPSSSHTPGSGQTPTLINAWSSYSGGSMSSPWGMSVDTSGNLYCALAGNERIAKFAADGTPITDFNGGGSLSSPTGVGVDGSGNMFVSNSTNTLVRLDSSGGFVQSTTGIVANVVNGANRVGSINSSPTPFSTPQQVSVHGSLVYVADAGNARVAVFNASDLSFVQSYVQSGVLIGPYGVGVDDSGTVFVVDHDGNHVVMFQASGSVTHDVGTSGSGPGQFNQPKQIDGMTTSSGEIGFVCDSGNSRVQAFDANGVYLTEWSTGPGSIPAGVAVNGSTGDIYVSDLENGTITRYRFP